MNIKKLIKKLLANTILSSLMLAIINFFGVYFNFSIAFNIYSVLTVGILGIPGIFVLIVLKFMA